MKRLLEKFNKDKLQKLLFLGLIALVFGVFTLSLVLTDSKPIDPNTEEKDPNGHKSIDPIENKDPKTDTSKNAKEKFGYPVDEKAVSVFRYFYSIDSSKETQEMALIQYGSKFMMSKGVTYRKEDNSSFDVLATLSGKVTKVEESSIYGNIITIDHGNGIISEYLGCSNVLVKENDIVKQYDIIASSGNAQYDEVASNHLHFRVMVDNVYVDPLKVMNQDIN